jgi:hypothetical protein
VKSETLKSPNPYHIGLYIYKNSSFLSFPNSLSLSLRFRSPYFSLSLKAPCLTRSTTSSPRPTPELPRLTLSKLVPSARTVTLSSKTALARFTFSSLFRSESRSSSSFASIFLLGFFVVHVI